jgi:LmbE family N-acetylglucosaminyl deacetylase
MTSQRLLCITAHPDDEAGAFGGSLALYSAKGVETYVVCLTPGQAARNRGGLVDDAELASRRRQEFADSCSILGITRGEVLNYADGQLEHAEPHAVVALLVDRIRKIQPQVIITYGPEGALTAHNDHSMASMFATLAYHWAGRSNRYTEQLNDGLRPHRTQKLYYSTAGFTLPERQPVSLSPQTVCIDIAEYMETKIRAFKAHTTQAPLVPFLEGTLRQRGHYEAYHLVANLLPGLQRMEMDLFEGVTEGSLS